MSEHARFSPSSASRWIACPGSLKLCEQQPARKDSVHSLEGTAAHQLAELSLTGKVNAEDFVGGQADNGVEYTEEMARYVQKYVDDINTYAENCDELLIEQRVDFSEQLGQPNSFGTSDAVIITDGYKELQVHDLKFGRGVQVYAEHNEQLMLYAAGALAEHDVAGSFERVVLVIHQPRLYHVDEWSVSVEELKAFVKEAKEAAEFAAEYAEGELEDDAPGIFNPGDKQCRWCTGKASCPALANFVAKSIGVSDFEDLTEETVTEARGQIKTLTPAQVGALLPLADMIVEWTKELRARAESELFAGVHVPGFKLVEGKRGNRKWRTDAEVEEAMKAMRLKKEEMYDFKIISPTTAEKLFAKTNPRRWTKLAKLITQSEGQPHVAPISDKREAYIPAKVVFDDLEEDFSDLV